MTEFKPFYTPRQMLALGVFDGKYFHDDPLCVPVGWKIAQENKYAPNVGQTRQEWIDAQWISYHDPLGWFQWYLRYWQGRRISGYDQWQIGRWASFGARHGAQVLKHGGGDISRRPRQRQGLLHWAHNPEPDVCSR